MNEVIKIWKRGCGRANLSFVINNGVADLQLSFNLGLYANNASCHANHTFGRAAQPRTKPKSVKRKSPSQRARDIRRAESYRLKKIQEVDLILPFTGELLPIKDIPAGEADVNNDLSEH